MAPPGLGSHKQFQGFLGPDNNGGTAHTTSEPEHVISTTTHRAARPQGLPILSLPRPNAWVANLHASLNNTQKELSTELTQGMMPRQACPQPNGLGRNLRSKTRWFTGFCNSHQVSHFATFFIDARAEISVAESHVKSSWRQYIHRTFYCCISLAPIAPGFVIHPSCQPVPELPGSSGHGACNPGCEGASLGASVPTHRMTIDKFTPVVLLCRGSVLHNDPSAGSPTETLIRLLLPLDSQVRPSSQRSARAVGRPRRGRSEGLTKPSNR